MVTHDIILDKLENARSLKDLVFQYQSLLAKQTESVLLQKHPSIDQTTIHNFLTLGSPAQTWFLVSKSEQFPEKENVKLLESLISNEILNNSNEVKLKNQPPFWHCSYIFDKPGFFTDNETPKFFRKEELSQDLINNLRSAFDLFKKIWPDGFEEFNQLINSIVFFDGKGDTGGTTPKSLGTIYLSTADRSTIALANSLVHESAHTILNILRSTDTLFTDSPNTPCFSPLRKTQRPLWGVFHSAFSLFRMEAFLKKAIHIGHQENTFSLLERFQSTQTETLKILENINFTKFGHQLFEVMKNENKK